MQLQIHAHKTLLFAVTEEWPGLFPTLKMCQQCLCMTDQTAETPELRDFSTLAICMPQKLCENHPRMASAGWI